MELFTSGERTPTTDQTLAHKTIEIMTIASTKSRMLNLTGGTDAWVMSGCLFGNAGEAVGCEFASGLLLRSALTWVMPDLELC
jgi:hypothetical protein